MAWQDEMVMELKAAVNGEKDVVIATYQQRTGKSPQTLYRIAAQHGYNPARKPRRDKGTCELTEQQILFVFGLIKETARERKGAIMTVEDALEIAMDNRIIDRGAISAARMQAILRERSINAEALKAPVPRIQMRSLHPNHVHQLDASVCIQYYLRPGRPLQILPENIFYKNKFENYAKIKRKIIRWVLTDHCSGMIYVKYYQSKGETQADLFDFLCSAWGSKTEKFPFRGVPQILMFDKGPANISDAMTGFLGRLGVEVPPSKPGNPARDGSVEKAQDIVERRFEARLRLQPASSVEELNAHALDWVTWFSATKEHTRHRMTRTGCWLRIAPEQLRELPDREILQDLFAAPEFERTVSPRYSMSYRTSEYDLRHIPNISPGAKVKVILRPFSFPELGVRWSDTEYTASPIQTGDYGYREDAPIIGREYKSMPETPAQQAGKKAENLAYGDERTKDQVPFAGLTVFGHLSEKVRHGYLPRAGTPMQVDRTAIEGKQIPMAELMKSLIAVGGPLSPDMNRRLREAYGTAVPRAEADRLIDEYASTGTLTPGAAEPAAAAGGSAC